MSDFAHVGRLDLTLHWRARKQVVFFYEVATELLAPLIPDQLELQEIRPGTSLGCLEILHYRVGHFATGDREFCEAVFAATVQPDLSIDMPVPRFGMFAMKVLSDSREFCDSEARTLFTPTTHVPGLRAEFDAAGSSCVLWNGDAVICECKNTAPEVPKKQMTVWGQYFTDTKGLQRGAWRCDGLASEHMKGGDAGSLHASELWNGIDPSKIGRVYRQMAAQPDDGTDIRFYHAGRLDQRSVATS